MTRISRLGMIVAALITILSGCSGTPAASSGGTYANPVMDRLFPDPTVIQAQDGAYYVYATQDDSGTLRINIQVARSLDLVHWEYLGDALPAPPEWAQTTPNGYWAPDVIYLEGSYVLYFTGELAGSESGGGHGDMCIGWAKADKPSGPFTAFATPLLCGTRTDVFDWSVIDPMVFKDPVSQKVFMYWGSMGTAIHVKELTLDGSAFLDESSPIDTVVPTSRPYEQVLEGSWLQYREPYYYLYFSGNDTWTHYAVMVARSKSPTGPFEMLADATGRASSAILEANGRWDCPGGNSVIRDAQGTDWIFYHAMDKTRMPEPRPQHPTRVLLMDRLSYTEDGWPMIEGAQPSEGQQPAPPVK